ncbi:MAG: 1,4-alpha-glucan branching protein [Chitinophagaceae bacterium]
MRIFFVAIPLFTLACCNLHSKTKTAETTTMDTIFKPVEWSHSTNIYEVNLRQYTPEGTINAFAKHLPRLKNMGVKTLWFMPITPIAQKNKKGSLGSYYACADYTAVNPEFGTLEDFKKLVKQTHEMGFKVIIDWVANHTGWDHVWTKQHPEYYKHDSATNDFKIASGMDDIIELNYKNPQLVKAMIDAMKFWVKECDIDGFRCDLAFWVELPFWKKARKELDAIKPLYWLGELDPLEHPEYMGTFDAGYTWTWMHKAKDFYQHQQSIASLDTVLHKYDSLGDQTMRTWFTSNHDENSWNGTEYEKYGEMAEALAVFSCTWNGIPLIYSGQELPNKKRLKFFEKDPIEWKEKLELEDFYQKLLTLHSTNPALAAGDASISTYRIHTADDKHVFCFLRKKGEHKVLVVLNLSKNKLKDLKIENDLVKENFTELFTGAGKNFSADNKISLEAWQYLVFSK